MREMAKNAVAALAAAATLLIAGCAGDQASKRADDPGYDRGSETTYRTESGTYAVPYSADLDKKDRAGRGRPSAPRGAKSVDDGVDTHDGLRRSTCLSGLPGGAYGSGDLQDDQMDAPEARAAKECPDWMEPRGTGGPGTSPVP